MRASRVDLHDLTGYDDRGRVARGFGMTNLISQTLPALRCWKRAGAVIAIALSAMPAAADEAAILKNIKSFFDTQDSGKRKEIADAIAADSAYDRGKLRDWLHAAGLFEKRPAGRTV